MMTKVSSLSSLLLALVALPVLAAPPFISSKDGPTLTAEDIIADMSERKVPAETQTRVLANPENIRRLAINLYVRRVFAERARQQGIDKEPEMARKLALIAERLLSETFLARAAGEPPEAAALERLARSEYDAGSDQFKIPEEIRARHILIERKRADVVKIAKEVLAKVKDGGDFEKLAQEYSDDPGSKARGGDLGFFARGRMARPFEEAAFALAKPGDISGLVETTFGLHIIKLEERKSASKKPYEQVKDELIRAAATRVMNDRRTGIVNAVEVPMNNEAIDAFVASRSTPVAPVAPAASSAPAAPAAATPTAAPAAAPAPAAK